VNDQALSVPDEQCQELPWDTSWWGFSTARVNSPPRDEADVRAIDAWCRLNRIRLLYFLCPSDDVGAARRAESSGFHLVDIRVTLERRSSGPRAPHGAGPEGVKLRLAGADDAGRLGDLAAAGFRGTRFYADPGLPDARCDDLYRVWMEQECAGQADTVVVAEVSGEIAGYLSYSVDRNGPGATIGLVGVAAPYRGMGIGSLVLTEALSLLGDSGVTEVAVVTQGRNVEALRLYERHGFLTVDTSFWFHKWYSTPTDRQG
jgi:ribosomal protein S18 acetylase RimI-like enzyme